MNRHVTEVKALVGPLDITKFIIDHGAEHNSIGEEEFMTYGCPQSFFKSKFRQEKLQFVNPSDPKGPAVPVLGYFEALFWSLGTFVDDKLYILAGSHTARVGSQIIKKLKLGQKFTEDINDMHSFPPLGKSKSVKITTV